MIARAIPGLYARANASENVNVNDRRKPQESERLWSIKMDRRAPNYNEREVATTVNEEGEGEK